MNNEYNERMRYLMTCKTTQTQGQRLAQRHTAAEGEAVCTRAPVTPPDLQTGGCFLRPLLLVFAKGTPVCRDAPSPLLAFPSVAASTCNVFSSSAHLGPTSLGPAQAPPPLRNSRSRPPPASRWPPAPLLPFRMIQAFVAIHIKT